MRSENSFHLSKMQRDELRLGLLGKVTLWGPNGPVRLTFKQSQVLAVLATHRNGSVSLDALADAIWNEKPPASSRNVIHGYVRDLRRAMAGAGFEGIDIATHASNYSLAVRPDLVDADVFSSAVERALEFFNAGDLEDAVCLLSEADSLWRGSMMLDVRSLIRLSGYITHVEEQRIFASELRVDALIQLRRHREAIMEIRPLLCEFPSNENFCMYAMYAMYLSGRRAEALNLYQEFRRGLIRDVGIDPGPMLKRLHELILQDSAEEISQRTGGAALLADRLAVLGGSAS